VRLGLTWIIGGVLIAVGVLPYAWRSNVPSPFTWPAGVGVFLLLSALVATAVVAWRRGSRLAILGLVLLFLGWLTAFFGGVVIALAGLPLYAIGVARAGVADARAQVAVWLTLAASFVAAYEVANELLSLELLACAAVEAGVGMALRRPPAAP
jgi:hypothetical protein